MTDLSLSCFKKEGISLLLNKIKNDKINYLGTEICNCYRIMPNEFQTDEKPEDTIISDNSQNNDSLKDFIFLLILYALFQLDIQKKISKSKLEPVQKENTNKTQTYKYYLVNKNIISEFENFFMDEKVYQIIKQYKIRSNHDIISTISIVILQDKDLQLFFKTLYNKKDNFKEKIKSMDFYQIETSSKKINNNILHFPKDLIFLDELTLLKFLSVFGIIDNEAKKKGTEILLNFNYGDIVFRGNESFFLNNKLYLMYIYSINTNSMEQNDFKLELILSFVSYTSFYNSFNDIISINIKYDSNFLASDFEKKYKCKINLLNDIPDNENETNLNAILEVLVELYIDYLNLVNKLNSSISGSSTITNKKETNYAINKKYIDDLEAMIFFKDLRDILNKNKQLYVNFDNKRDECLNSIKNILSSEIKEKLSELGDNHILDKLNKNNEDYKLEIAEYQHTNVCYYTNFVVINSQITKIIMNNLTKSIASFVEPVDCICDNNHLIIQFKDYISVGHLGNNNEIIVDILISPEFNDFTQKIFDKIKQEGYNFIQRALELGKIQIKHKHGSNHHSYIEGEIYNLSKEYNINNEIQKSDISEKLKKIILLYLELSNNSIFESSDKLAEEIYLINSQILSESYFGEINSLFDNNDKVLQILSKYKSSKNISYSNYLEEIISNLDEKQLQKLDVKCRSFKFKSIIPKKQTVELVANKQINIYREFIIIRKNIYTDIYFELGLNKLPRVFYTKIGEGDIIIDEFQENIVLGNINENNYFSINYILNFSYSGDLQNELSKIKKFGIKKYLNDTTVFNDEKSDDLISPIFSKKDRLGYCYIMKPGINNYTGKKDYSSYLENANLLTAYILYDYYEKFKEKLNSNYSQKKDFYLIKKEIMLKIKKDYYYKDLKEILDQMNHKEIIQTNQSKILLYLLKHLPDDIFEEFIGEGTYIHKINKDKTEPDIEPACPNNMLKNGEQSPVIYKNFEIIEPSVAKHFIHDIDESSYLYSHSFKDNNMVKCILKDGKIMVIYDQNLFENKKDIIIIGIINSDNTFINEYALIYDKYFSNHLDYLQKTDLNNYLSKISFANDICPIVINGYVEIGNIYRLQNNNINTNIDINFDEPMDIDEQIPNKNIINEPHDGNRRQKDKTNVGQSSQFGKKKDSSHYYSLEDEEYNLNSNTNVSSIDQYFAFPPLIGLDNIGATCYMNATLQCLCNIKKFVDYFKYKPHLIEIVKNDIGKKQLCSSFKLLIEKLWPDNYNTSNRTHINVKSRSFAYQSFNSYETKTIGNNKSFPPEDFKRKISKMNPLFEGIAANDAKDLVQFLLMTLHDELNRAQGNNNNNVINKDQRNKQLMFQIFANDFMMTNKSIISGLFYGVNYSITQCGFCNTQSFNYQTYFFLIFPLEEVRIFKSQNNMNFNYNCFNNNEVNIYDCFYYDQKITYMTGSNIMYCNYCQHTCNSSMRTFLSTGPEILIIILNRGKGIQYKVKINFLEVINLENFIEMKQTGCNYRLIGVITHLGESGMGGHFIAYCKNPISNEWNKYNDSIVSQVENFQKEVIDFAMPYLLFYQKIN